jgi:hypothetical protein
LKKKLEYLIGNWKGLICKRATDTEYEKSLDDHAHVQCKKAISKILC